MAARTRNSEELASAITHGLGVLAALTAATLLIVRASVLGNPWAIVGASLFGATLVLLYLASTLYHLSIAPVTRARLKIFDHSAIYLLIAGTYTPFMLGDLRGAWGWSLFGVIWGLAAAGVAFKLFFAGRFKAVSTVIYIAMGWLVLIAIGPMIRSLSADALGWLLAGGIAYTAGTPFYHWTRLPYSHAIWHLFVLGGSACHSIAVAIQL